MARVFDAVTLRAITDELNETIVRGRVQEIVQMDALAFGFEIYAKRMRRYLYINAHPDEARVHLVSQKVRGSGQAPSPLLLLLRKYAENTFIDSITQLPHERVLKIQFDHSIEGISTLVVETIGKYSNIILLDANALVLDAAKRVGADINRARVILPRHAYIPPPPQSKFAPSALTTTDWANILLENRGMPTWQVLVRTIAGVSPLLAREIAFRVQGRTDALCDPTRAEELLQTLERLSHTPWQPTVAFEDDEPAAFAPYTLTQFTTTRTFNSISAAIEAFYGTTESYAAVKEPLRAQIAEARDRLARKRSALAESLPRAADVERLRVSGETILAHAHEIARGQERLLVEIGDERLEIPLNPNLSVVENAQRFFKEYHRQKDALARVPTLLAAANAEVEYAEQMLNDLDLAENRTEIDAVVAAACEAGLIAAPKRRVKVTSGTPREFTSRDGFQILVGKNARQNEEITFRRARADDVWLHARNVAGAHVIIIRAGREILETTIVEAAQLAAYYSAARGDTRVDVIVAPRRNVHRVRGGRTGMVMVRGGKICTVSAAEYGERRAPID